MVFSRRFEVGWVVGRSRDGVRSLALVVHLAQPGRGPLRGPYSVEQPSNKAQDRPDSDLPFHQFWPAWAHSRANANQTEVLLSAIEASDSVQVTSAGDGVVRTTEAALDKLTRSSLVPRSVYCKGVERDATLEALQAEFGRHGTVGAVLRRRAPPGSKFQFKESVFVVYASEAEAKKIVEDAPADAGGKALSWMMRAAYVARKRRGVGGRVLTSCLFVPPTMLACRMFSMFSWPFLALSLAVHPFRVHNPTE